MSEQLRNIVYFCGWQLSDKSRERKVPGSRIGRLASFGSKWCTPSITSSSGSLIDSEIVISALCFTDAKTTRAVLFVKIAVNKVYIVGALRVILLIFLAGLAAGLGMGALAEVTRRSLGITNSKQTGLLLPFTFIHALDGSTYIVELWQ